MVLKSRKTSGIVIQESRCDTSARPAAIEVSFPYPAGITIVLRPSGIASAQIMQSLISLESGRKSKTARPRRGNKTSLIIEIT